MLDSLFVATQALQTNCDVQMPFKLAVCTCKTLICIVKLSSLSLGKAQIVPDARIVWGQFRRALEMLDSTLVIAFFQEGVSQVIKVLGLIGVHTRSHFKRLQSSVPKSLLFICQTYQVMRFSSVRFNRGGPRQFRDALVGISGIEKLAPLDQVLRS